MFMKKPLLSNVPLASQTNRFLKLSLALCAVFVLITSYSAKAQRDCFSDEWHSPWQRGGQGVRELLKDIPISRKWHDLPIATKQEST
jgi:hypothetical protein